MTEFGSTLATWRLLASLPCGKWLFSRLACWNAPYFRTIRPRFCELRPNHCSVRMKKCQAVLNRSGSIHVIALCNMAELAASTMTEVTLAPGLTWAPRRMTVEYYRRATTDILAVALPTVLDSEPAPGEYQVRVISTDRDGEIVFRAKITLWISAPR